MSNDLKLIKQPDSSAVINADESGYSQALARKKLERQRRLDKAKLEDLEKRVCKLEELLTAINNHNV